MENKLNLERVIQNLRECVGLIPDRKKSGEPNDLFIMYLDMLKKDIVNALETAEDLKKG